MPHSSGAIKVPLNGISPIDQLQSEARALDEAVMPCVARHQRPVALDGARGDERVETADGRSGALQSGADARGQSVITRSRRDFFVHRNQLEKFGDLARGLFAVQAEEHFVNGRAGKAQLSVFIKIIGGVAQHDLIFGLDDFRQSIGV